MQYKFVAERQDYSCYASGHVLHSAPGLAAFPIRLASEVFLSCMDLLQLDRPCTLYDPCCGAAYHATALGLSGQRIDLVFADVPYGKMAAWQAVGSSENPVRAIVDTLAKVVSSKSLVAVASLKAEKVEADGFQRIKQLKTGKRVVTILRKMDDW